jgi:hypothetical protein
LHTLHYFAYINFCLFKMFVFSFKFTSKSNFWRLTLLAKCLQNK